MRDWHSASLPAEVVSNLPAIVAGVLTEKVTTALPAAWHGEFTSERAAEWIDERDLEGLTLLVLEKSTRVPVGLIILFETSFDDGPEVRLGYLLAESSWGKGFATELVDGLVRWSHGQSGISSLAGGVARDNPASRRVLEKNGFTPSGRVGESGESEEILRLVLRRG